MNLDSNRRARALVYIAIKLVFMKIDLSDENKERKQMKSITKFVLILFSLGQ